MALKNLDKTIDYIGFIYNKNNHRRKPGQKEVKDGLISTIQMASTKDIEDKLKKQIESIVNKNKEN